MITDERVYVISNLGGWLVGCVGFNGILRQYFSLYRAVLSVDSKLERAVVIRRWCWVTVSGRGVLTHLDNSRKGPTVLAVDAGGGCLGIFFLPSS